MIKENNGWKGYTLDELRFQRMLALAKIEIEKDQLSHQMNSLSKFGGFGGPIMSKLTSALSYVDYVVVAFRVIRTISKMVKRNK